MTSKTTLCKEITLDITSAPHILIAGTTGSGKSVMMHSIICSLLQGNDPDSAEFILIDPKQVEFTFYEDLPGVRVCYDSTEAYSLLSSAIMEMERRFSVMKANRTRVWSGKKTYIFIDELADLMLGSRKTIEPLITRIAQKGRAAGVHLILATQYPTKQVFSTVIKANVPTRIALKVKTRSDSMTIIDRTGAELLQGKGDAILSKADGEEIHFQGRFLSDAEIEEITDTYREMYTSVPEILPEITAEPTVTSVSYAEPVPYIPSETSSDDVPVIRTSRVTETMDNIRNFIVSFTLVLGIILLLAF